MADFVDETGQHRDLDAEQAAFEPAWKFRIRYSPAEPTYLASAYQHWKWFPAPFGADGATSDDARAALLDLMTEVLRDRKR